MDLFWAYLRNNFVIQISLNNLVIEFDYECSGKLKCGFFERRIYFNKTTLYTIFSFLEIKSLEQIIYVDFLSSNIKDYYNTYDVLHLLQNLIKDSEPFIYSKKDHKTIHKNNQKYCSVLTCFLFVLNHKQDNCNQHS